MVGAIRKEFYQNSTGILYFNGIEVEALALDRRERRHQQGA